MLKYVADAYSATAARTLQASELPCPPVPSVTQAPPLMSSQYVLPLSTTHMAGGMEGGGGGEGGAGGGEGGEGGEGGAGGGERKQATEIPILYH